MDERGDHTMDGIVREKVSDRKKKKKNVGGPIYNSEESRV